METGKFLFKNKIYISCGFLSEDVHYARAYDIKAWRTGWRVSNASDGKTYRIVIGRIYVLISITKRGGGECPA